MSDGEEIDQLEQDVLAWVGILGVATARAMIVGGRKNWRLVTWARRQLARRVKRLGDLALDLSRSSPAGYRRAVIVFERLGGSHLAAVP